MQRRLPVLSIVILIFFGRCTSDNISLAPEGTLEAFMQNNSALTPVNQLIACASGGQEVFLEDPENPVSIYFLPEGDARDFRYFETDSFGVDNRDFSLYRELPLNDVPIFGGFLRYFERDSIDRERWCIVTFIKGDSLHYSTPVRLRFPDLPSEFNPDLLTFDQSELLSPRFEWEDGRIQENEIYFHAITGPDGNLLSGTYTFDRNWQFYDLSNVVLNIRDVTPEPELVLNSEYTYTMLGVSIDSWVNLIITRDFNTFQ